MGKGGVLIIYFNVQQLLSGQEEPGWNNLV